MVFLGWVWGFSVSWWCLKVRGRFWRLMSDVGEYERKVSWLVGVDG